MTFHLFGNLITPRGVAANNRGETEGNRTTLPKVYWGNKLHVSVSAEAIRWAIRYFWQTQNCSVNRLWIEEEQNTNWLGSPNNSSERFDPQAYIDDDVLGYMEAKPGRGQEVRKRRGALDVTRAVSLESADKIEITFSSRSGKKGKKGGGDAESEAARTSIYSTETITTRFQWGFALTPERLVAPARVLDVLSAVTKLANVGGNHARFLYDFAPESCIFRWTHHPVPQFLFCFEQPEADILSAPSLVRLIECEEIPASEIWILGGYAFTEEAEQLTNLGCHVHPSLRKGVAALSTQIASDQGLKLEEDKGVDIAS